MSRELEALRGEVVRLNEQRYFRHESSFLWIAAWSLTRGLFFGLGSVLGASILVAFVVQMLASIDFIPIIGDWGQQLIEEIELNVPQKTNGPR
ncbi:MAG: hypothetical protein CSA74_10290 [Rhodobacterales bacterium]|nr:MAG: hypothetical protein CSA74_10290 [Rhodobacterales bacterium]